MTVSFQLVCVRPHHFSSEFQMKADVIWPVFLVLYWDITFALKNLSFIAPAYTSDRLYLASQPVLCYTGI